MTYPGGGVTPGGSTGAPAARAAVLGVAGVGGAAPGFCCANADAAAPEQAKQKAKIRAFSKIFRAPTKFDVVRTDTGTAGELCKYVARGCRGGLLAPNHSTPAT